jgi:hypothetical protein
MNVRLTSLQFNLQPLIKLNERWIEGEEKWKKQMYAW